LLAVEQTTPLLEKLFDLTLHGNDREQTLPHYVAFHYLQGNLDKRIAHFQKVAADGKDKEKAYEVLFFLYRARGEMNAARSAAEQARRMDLVIGLLEEQRKWDELIAKDAPMDDRQLVERLSYRAAYLRLAGKPKEFDEAIATLKKHAEELDAPGVDRWNAVKALLLNDRTEEGLALMDK